MEIISGDGDDEANAKVGRVNVSTDFIESFELSLVADSFIQLATYKSIATRGSVDEMSVRPHIRRTEEKKWRLINEQNSITFTIGLCPSLVSLSPLCCVVGVGGGCCLQGNIYGPEHRSNQSPKERSDELGGIKQ